MRRRVDALEQYHWSSYAFFAGTRAAPAWLCTESIFAFFGPGSQCELQKAFRQQLREAAAIGRWETEWKAHVKYTVFLGSAEFVAQMRKLLRGDRRSLWVTSELLFQGNTKNDSSTLSDFATHLQVK